MCKEFSRFWNPTCMYGYQYKMSISWTKIHLVTQQFLFQDLHLWHKQARDVSCTIILCHSMLSHIQTTGLCYTLLASWWAAGQARVDYRVWHRLGSWGCQETGLVWPQHICWLLHRDRGNYSEKTVLQQVSNPLSLSLCLLLQPRAKKIILFLVVVRTIYKGPAHQHFYWPFSWKLPPPKTLENQKHQEIYH